MHLVLKTAPTVLPASVAEIKTHLRISHAADDAYLAAVASAVAEWIDGYSGHLRRALLTQTWYARMRDWPEGCRVRLPLPPLQSVVAVTYYDASNVLQTFGAGNYHVTAPNGGAGEIELAALASWPAVYDRPDAISIEFVAGYGNAAANVPAPIRQAALLIAGDMYANRGDDPQALMAPDAQRSANILAAEALLSRYVWREFA